MPTRIIPLVNGEIYHIYNHSISFTPIATFKRDWKRAIEILNYYQFSSTPISFSKLKTISLQTQETLLRKLKEGGDYLVRILCFCLMPNHFHLLLKQTKEKGISRFVANFQNSYTRYFNLKNKRLGPLFRGTFKAVRIENDSQLLHVSRYIHLNPYSSLVVKTLDQLENYPASSLVQYLHPEKGGFCLIKEILEFFSSPNQYKKFVFDQADYQKELDKIKHLILE